MFERDSRTSRMQFPLWWMDIGDRNAPSNKRRRLIIEPYTIRSSSYPVELRVWVEDDVPQYYYTVKSITAKPRGAPTFRIEPVVVEASRRSVPAKTGLEAVVIEALATNELTGEGAKRALSNLFWMHFVEDDEGLTWLYRYATRDLGNFYAHQRLAEYTRVREREDTRDSYQARHAVEDVMKHDRELGERMCRHVVEDEAFQQAIEVLLMTDEDEETQHANIRRLVELNVTDKDRVFAGIVAASHSNALRGLRACQRAERDPEFFEAIAAIARVERVPAVRAKRINAFLHKSRKS